jgi:hypothetical protein
MEWRVGPVLVGSGFASGAFGPVAAQGYLRADYDQGEPEDRREGELLAEQDHTVEEREDGRDVVAQSDPLLPHLGDELVVEHEGERRAEEAEHDNGYDRTLRAYGSRR